MVKHFQMICQIGARSFDADGRIQLGQLWLRDFSAILAHVGLADVELRADVEKVGVFRVVQHETLHASQRNVLG